MAEEAFDSTVAIVPDAQEFSPVPKPSDVPSLPQPNLPTLAPKLEPQDTPMAEAAPSPAPQYSATTPTPQNPPYVSTPQNSASASTPQPARNATPVRSTNGVPEPVPLPLKAAPHGAPVRRYLNEKVTGVLLEGMKKVALEQPEDPLRVLGEYLLQRSRELEGGQGTA